MAYISIKHQRSFQRILKKTIITWGKGCNCKLKLNWNWIKMQLDLIFVSVLWDLTILRKKVSNNFSFISGYSSLKPRLHMAHFKRTRLGTEPGSVPGPVTRLFTLSGPCTVPTRSSTWPPSICAMQCLCSSLFLDFGDSTELRWPVCCDHETLIYFILPYLWILGAIQQTNSRRGAWSLLRFCVGLLGKKEVEKLRFWQVTHAHDITMRVVYIIYM